MLSKNQIKLITSLQQKKYRQKHQLFFAEGTKVISEFYKSGWKLHTLFSTETLSFISAGKTTQISEAELKKISALKTPQSALAVFYLPQQHEIIEPNFSVVLDGIQDPGNLGTLIRLCDWFGAKQLVCSPDTADCYNPKVVQTSMGSLARVNVVYVDLESFLSEKNKLPVYGAFMDGENIYNQTLPEKAVLVLGNEGKGISPKIEQLITSKIAIPQFGKEQLTESLNVATAAAIILSEFHRAIEK
jgi:RNA methyltransferase, TrmH family